MNPSSLDQAETLFNSISGKQGVEVVICPPFVYLPELSSSEIKLGGQDCFWKERGAFTGEISPAMLKDLGCEYVIVGHSERRDIFKEDDQMISKKVKAVTEQDLTPVLCVGETAQEREKGETEQVLKKQLGTGLKSVDQASAIIGYEPRWAIGSGNACEPSQAQEAASLIKQEFDRETPVVYGGSVNSENAASYLGAFEGLLIGGASLESEKFNKIIETAASF